MSTELQRVVETLRNTMDMRTEWRMMNSLPAGAQLKDLPADLPASLRTFLTVANGATCGDVSIFSASTAEEMQFYADPISGAEITLGREKWLCCGVIVDDPFFVNRLSGEVWYFPDTGVEWWKSSSFEKAADDFTSFFLRFVAGSCYVDVSATGREDQWAELLRQVGLLE
ncbi:SMI1/KNR4 family protein [Streptomyces sp. TRM68367]|uniref:SMI1/KNR4 family protein n=1 Tax=Streptomyces sp. TRM68367 TaxID=2758415 RepID=UPI00165B4406|nr:SMI1/KNR4 family protein [Streptomyces sp. TRM68367]MBC9731542.1 SMI1/KNR4 family protein [Streptomyces sp. TRM68367]